MAPVYPIRFADQLRQHVRALRKRRGLTQAALGQLLGVSQARIAEIEANPGLVNLDQMLQLFSALGATLSLAEEESAASTTSADMTATPVHAEAWPGAGADPASVTGSIARPVSRRTAWHDYSVQAPAAEWPAGPGGGAPDRAGVRQPDPAPPAPFVARAKKGSW